jgi:hypothetical protein
VCRALMQGQIQAFEFHLSGNKTTAISVVEVIEK